MGSLNPKSKLYLDGVRFDIYCAPKVGDLGLEAGVQYDIARLQVCSTPTQASRQSILGSKRESTKMTLPGFR